MTAEEAARLAISIHAPRTGSDAGRWIWHTSDFTISIHAPRTGSDDNLVIREITDSISIHAPRTGSDIDAVRYALNRV